MKEYYVQYYLGDVLHGYIIEAKCEADAIAAAMSNIRYSKDIMHDFEISRKEVEW